MMTFNILKILSVVFILFLSSPTIGTEVETVGVFSVYSDRGNNFSINYTEDDYIYQAKVYAEPVIKSVKNRNWPINSTLNKLVISELKKNNQYTVSHLSKKNLSKVEIDEILTSSLRSKFTQRSIEYISQAAKKQGLSKVLLITPATINIHNIMQYQYFYGTYHLIPNSFGNIYIRHNLVSYLCYRLTLIDTNKRAVLQSVSDVSLQDIEIKRAPTEQEIAVILKKMNEDVSNEENKVQRSELALGRALTSIDKRKIMDKISEDDDTDLAEDIHLLLNPPHHTQATYPTQTPEVRLEMWRQLEEKLARDIPASVNEILYPDSDNSDF